MVKNPSKPTYALRFTPFFVNSGFYFQRHTPQSLFLMEKMLKAVGEISATKSHQAILTRQITEAHHLVGLQVGVVCHMSYAYWKI
jgi:hypothetical protein